MIEGARGQNEANKIVRRKYLFRYSYLSQHCRYNDETYGIYTIEDGEYFGEVKLRLTTSLRREMRLTSFLVYNLHY